MDTKDYYRILGVEPGESPQGIKEAYRKLALKYHPDRNQEDPALGEKMKVINEAYAVLSNPNKRAEYDRMRDMFGSSATHRFRETYNQQDIFRDSDIFQIFEEMARSFGLRGVDAIFRDLYDGSTYQSFDFHRGGFHARGFIFRGPKAFSGPLRFSAPTGAGTLGKIGRILLGKIGGVAMDGSDRFDTIRIPPETADAGGPYAYRVKEREKKLVVMIPAGIRSGQKIRLAGMGENGKGGGRPGDLYLTVKIQRPMLDRLKKRLARILSASSPD